MRDKPAEPRKEGANPEQRKQSSSLVSFLELRTTCVSIQVDRHRNHKGCPSLSSRNTTTEIGQAVVPVVYSRVDWKVAEALARPVSRGVPLFSVLRMAGQGAVLFRKPNQSGNFFIFNLICCIAVLYVPLFCQLAVQYAWLRDSTTTAECQKEGKKRKLR